MVKVILKDLNISFEEALIAQALAESIEGDLEGLQCRCGSDSHVTLIVDKSKMTALRTEISACCGMFREKIEEALLVEAY